MKLSSYLGILVFAASLFFINSSLTEAAICPNLSRSLYLGLSGNDVTELQRFLKETGDFTYPELTGYFGPATEQAVQRFQCREMKICSGSPESNGYGVVGPQTRTKIANVCSANGGGGGAGTTYSQSSYYNQSSYYSESGYNGGGGGWNLTKPEISVDSIDGTKVTISISACTSGKINWGDSTKKNHLRQRSASRRG